MKRNLFTHNWLALFLLLVVGLTASAVSPVYAQNYYFEVPEVIMEVVIQPDSTAEIFYTITFNNRGSTIDIVDIGLPHSNYDISNMSGRGWCARQRHSRVGICEPRRRNPLG